MAEQMRFAAFSHGGKTKYGAVMDTGLVDLAARHGASYPNLHRAIAADALGQLAETATRYGPDYALTDISFEIPIATPEKILCVGVNYPDRNAEYKDGQSAPEYSSLFVRFPRSFVGHGHALIRPTISEQLDYEGEVGIIIGKPGRHIPERDALAHIAALTICNDGSVRDWLRHGKFNVTQGKNFDGSGAIGPWIVPFSQEEQIADIELKTRVNGELRQQDRTSRMIFSFRRLINYISTFTTLTSGDIILTGTPTGAGARLEPPVWLKQGDVVEVEIEGIGVLRNSVIDEGTA